MKQQKQNSVQQKNQKKMPYETPKTTELGSVQQLTQLQKGNDCGSNVSFKTLIK